MPAKTAHVLPWILGLGLLAAALLWQWQGDVEDGEWSYLELAPELEEDGSIAGGASEPSEEGGEIALEDGAPIDCELRLTALSALSFEDKRYGDETLEVHFKFTKASGGRRSASAVLSFVAGLPERRFRRVQNLAGYVKFTGMPSGRFVLRCEGSERLGAPIFETVVRLPRKDALEVDWGKRGGVRGRVEDDRGKAVAGAKVEIHGRELTTDGEGRFAVDGLIAGSMCPLIVRAPRRLLYCEMVEVTAKPSELRFSLPPAWTVRVTAPVEDPSKIAVVPAGGGARFFPYYAIRPRALGRGRFEIDGLPLGHDIGLAIVDALRVSRGPSVVKAPLTPRVVDGVVRTEHVESVSGTVRSTGEKLTDFVVTAVDDKKRPWGETLYTGALIPAGSAALGSCSVVPASDGSYRVGMPGRRSRVVARGTNREVDALSRVPVEQARVLYRARRLRADFELEAPEIVLEVEDFFEDPIEAWGGLDVAFRDLPARVRRLKIQVFWAGQARGKPLLHDPREKLSIPLGAPAELDVVFRRRGGTRGFQTQIRAYGRDDVAIPYEIATR